MQTNENKQNDSNSELLLTSVLCCVCETDDAKPVGVGTDFEYNTSRNTFLAMQCHSCGLVYLNPRPSVDEFDRIYPSNYHAFDFSENNFGFVYKVRRRLEARRLLSWCKGLKADAKIIDVGCGDGFHLDLLKEFGNKSWTIEGIDTSERAVTAAEKKGLKVHPGSVEQLELENESYDLAFLIQTIEHLETPDKVLDSVRRLLKPGGKIVIVTDNTDSPDFKLFKGGYWGGYHFPRHWNLFNKKTLSALAQKVDLEVVSINTIVSPVNWVYSIRNTLVDLNYPKWLVNRFSLGSTASLSAFTLFDYTFQLLGKGALLNGVLRRPE